MNATPGGHYPDELHSLPHAYWQSGDLPAFMAGASSFILRYCRARLSRDDDLVGDFYVHFYEKAPTCLEQYKSRQNYPFTGYLASYLRHEFLNFRRKVRESERMERPTADVITRGNRGGLLNFAADCNAEDDALAEMYEPSATDSHSYFDGTLLANLPLRLRLPLKLYYGLELDLEELETVTRLHDTPAGAAAFLVDWRQRRDRWNAEMQRLEDRAAHLTYLLFHGTGPSGRKPQDTKRSHERWSRWKRRLQERMYRNRGLMSTAELGALFGLSKSSIARRLQRALKLIQGSCFE